MTSGVRLRVTNIVAYDNGILIINFAGVVCSLSRKRREKTTVAVGSNRPNKLSSFIMHYKTIIQCLALFWCSGVSLSVGCVIN